MRSGDDVPLVQAGTRMSDALVVMTAKSLGCVVIVGADGRLTGIITDGDLRRHMSARLLELPVERDHDAGAEDGAARAARQRGAGILNTSKKTS